MGDNSKYDLNLTTTKDKSFLPVCQDCLMCISSQTCKGGTQEVKHLSGIHRTTHMLSLLLNRQTNNHYGFQDTMSRCILTESEFIKIEKHWIFNQKESPMNCQYDMLLTESSSSVPGVQKASENRRGSSDNRGFYCAVEDNVSADLDVNNYMNQTFGPQRKERETPIELSWNTDFYWNRENQQIPTGIVPEITMTQDHQGNGPPSPQLDLQPALRPTHATTLTFVPTNWLAIPRPSDAKEDSYWYVVADKLGMKEKLTRRQLFQIAAMMGLGFVFVALIAVWVFSPMLF